MMILLKITTLSNAISLSRAPLALMFLSESPFWRVVSIFLAMLTDVLDGFLARRYKTVTKLGTILDPLMDRFFVAITLGILYSESRLSGFEITALLSRDIVMCSFMLYLRLTKEWEQCEIQATFWGKITTFGQFCILLALVTEYSIPLFVYAAFILFGIFLIKELFSLLDHE